MTFDDDNYVAATSTTASVVSFFTLAFDFDRFIGFSIAGAFNSQHSSNKSIN